MELLKIQIENFRSIKEAELLFPHNCLILLGKNEAGKSNLLKAIASLFGTYLVSTRDKRKRLDNEKLDDFYIRAVFKLSPGDFKIVEDRLRKKFEGHENIVFKSGITLRQFIEKVFYSLLLQIDISETSKPYFTYWNYIKTDTELQNPLFVTGTVISKTAGARFDLNTETLTIVKALYNEQPIKCHYWQYSDNYLLPNEVTIEEFVTDPSKFPALENIFALCNRGNIKEEFEAAESEDGDYSNLLDQVSRKITTTFHKIWKDFKGTSIQLLPNGDDILIKVVDKAKYNFEDRSDGFKKFISILLMLSTQSRANKILENDLILIDEPDQSLYPTSAQYLRNELLEISKKSKVIYSTHSQYMIDPDCLDRHIIVEKKDDITTLANENVNAPFTTDELLRRAIGSSIFECLKPKNIIFEGYLDKELFQLYCKSNKLEKEFNQYGIVYLNGISGAETLVQILTLANKKFVIVADSDETSKNKRTDFEKNYPALKDSWLAYADICKTVSTMEDFILPEHIQEQFKKDGYSHIYEEGKNAIANIEKAVNKDKDLKQAFKNSLIATVRNEHISANYNDFVKKITALLQSL